MQTAPEIVARINKRLTHMELQSKGYLLILKLLEKNLDDICVWEDQIKIDVPVVSAPHSLHSLLRSHFDWMQECLEYRVQPVLHKRLGNADMKWKSGPTNFWLEIWFVPEDSESELEETERND